MIIIHPQYITDTAGKKLVILPVNEFDLLMDQLDELEDIRLYDEVKSQDEPTLKIDEAFEIVDKNRAAKEK